MGEFMTAKLDKVWSEVDELQPEEQLELLERIAHSLRYQNTNSGSNGHSKPEPEPAQSQAEPDIWAGITWPKSTPEEIEAELLEIFGADLMAEMEKVDLDNLPPPPPGFPTMTEIISEGRGEW